jgi:AbrB family looped-hinge helix DNA binding protein
MKDVKILTMDNRGRIVIPQSVRKCVGISENQQLMVIADSDTKEIKITPVGIKGETLMFRIKMSDHVGSLAKIATVFGKNNVNLVYGESVIIEKDKTAIWTVIGARPKDIELEELVAILKKEGDALEVFVEVLEK